MFKPPVRVRGKRRSGGGGGAPRRSKPPGPKDPPSRGSVPKIPLVKV